MPRLQKIDQIKGYKSYGDYQWGQFGAYKKSDSSDEEQVEFDTHFNVIFGENGSGKSCIAEVLKSLACARGFKTSPSSVTLSFKAEGSVKFDALSAWSKTFSKNDFIFFDSDFVSKNVHTHGLRDGTFGGHKQNAGELVLSVDEKYDQFRTAMRKAKEVWQEQNNNPLVSKSDLTGPEKSLFKKTQTLDADKQAKKRAELLSAQREKQEKIEILKRNQQQLTEIAGINLPSLISNGIVLSDGERYRTVFDDVLKSAHAIARQDVVTKVNANRFFYEKGVELSGTGNACPFCEQEYGEQAKRLIEEYQNIFNKQYREQKNRRATEITALLGEIRKVSEAEASLRKVLQSKISEYRIISEKYGLEKFSVEAEQKLYGMLNFPTENLFALNDSLEGLQKGKTVSFDENSYSSVRQVVTTVGKVIRSLNTYIRMCRWKIIRFKTGRSSDQLLGEEIERKESDLKKIEFELRCLDTAWVKERNDIEMAKQKLKTLADEKDTTKSNYDEYCKKIPGDVVAKIQALVNDHFHFKFKLVPIKPARQTNEYPFDFEIEDETGKKREFDDGLSEGERQVISLCFFFSTLPENGLKDKIVVFDDPITSLDSRNLKRLVELIKNRCLQAQTFILTHHPLFYKYLAKDSGGTVFGVLRNQTSFGGSFIYPENRRLTILDRLNAVPDEMKKRLGAGELNAQAFTLEHGHLLRYAVEKFVKDGLQGWNDKTFEQRINKFRDKPALTNQEYAAIKSIYDFCNWSNHLHPDKEDPAALGELLLHVETFVKLAEPHKELWV